MGTLENGRESAKLPIQNFIIKIFQRFKQERLVNQLILVNKAKYSEMSRK